MFWFVTDLDIRQFSFPQFPIGVEYLLNFDGFRCNLANQRELVPASRLASAALGGDHKDVTERGVVKSNVIKVCVAGPVLTAQLVVAQ